MTRQNKTEIKQQISKTELYSGAVPHPALLKLISRLIGQFSMLFIVLCFLVFTFVSMLVFKNLYVSIAGIVGTVVCAAIRKFSK